MLNSISNLNDISLAWHYTYNYAKHNEKNWGLRQFFLSTKFSVCLQFGNLKISSNHLSKQNKSAETEHQLNSFLLSSTFRTIEIKKHNYIFVIKSMRTLTQCAINMNKVPCTLQRSTAENQLPNHPHCLPSNSFWSASHPDWCEPSLSAKAKRSEKHFIFQTEKRDKFKTFWSEN